MLHQDQQSAPLSIERHAVQYILHASLSGPDDACTGLIGLRHNGIISHAVLLPGMQPDALTATCNGWQQKGISPCGTFSASAKNDTPTPEKIGAFSALLRQACRESGSNEMIHLLISLNTKGCLETQAFRLEGERVVSIPLVLLEDGQAS